MYKARKNISRNYQRRLHTRDRLMHSTAMWHLL